jgi:hypothetical protein
LATLLVLFSLNHRLPSGPAAIPAGALLTVGIGNSVIVFGPRADHLAGHRVTHRQSWDALAAQNPADGSGRETELRAEPVLAPAVLVAGRHHERLDLGTGLRRHPMRPRRPII